jgi:hypothetical protein
MDHGPSRRGTAVPRRITTAGGMCGPTAPTALRRRSFRSSDRGRDFVFGSSPGRPGEHDDCLARAGPPACWRRRSHEPPRVHLRVTPTARRATRSFGGRGGRFDAAPFGAQREWRARAHAFGRAWVRRAVSPSGTRATAEGWGARARTTGRRSSERALGRVRVSSEMRRDDAGTPTPSGAGADAVGPPLGADPLALHLSFGARGGVRPRRLLRETPEPPRPAAIVPSGRLAAHGSQEPDRAETPCLPSTFGSGDAEAVRAARRNVQPGAGRRESAAASERVDPKPKGASSERASATSRATQRTLRWKKALRPTSRHAHRGDTDARTARNGEKAHQSVNANASERTRRGDGMVVGCRRGERFEGYSPQGTIPGWTARSTTRWVGARSRDRAGSPKLGEPHGRLRGATNPRTVERVGPRIHSAAEETAGAGRNGKSGARSGRGSPEPKSGRRPRREVDAATIVSAEGRSMNPKRGVRDVEVDLRVGGNGPGPREPVRL